MNQLIKKMLVLILQPFAMLHNRLEALSRLWANACLKNALDSPVDSSVVVMNMPELQGTKKISLGKNLYLYRDLYFETQESGQISLGNDIVLSRGVHLVAFQSIILHDGVMIGEYSSIRDGNHRIVSEGSIRNSGFEAKAIEVGRNVWIGRGVTILGGVSIGENAVIGANAVVTHNIPAGTVAVGVPARVIKRH